MIFNLCSEIEWTGIGKSNKTKRSLSFSSFSKCMRKKSPQHNWKFHENFEFSTRKPKKEEFINFNRKNKLNSSLNELDSLTWVQPRKIGIASRPYFPVGANWRWIFSKWTHVRRVYVIKNNWRQIEHRLGSSIVLSLQRLFYPNVRNYLSSEIVHIRFRTISFFGFWRFFCQKKVQKIASHVLVFFFFFVFRYSKPSIRMARRMWNTWLVIRMVFVDIVPKRTWFGCGVRVCLFIRLFLFL